MSEPVSEYMSTIEIADLAGVTRQAVLHWKNHTADFPRPATKIGGKDLYNRQKVELWLVKHGKYRAPKPPIEHATRTLMPEIHRDSPAWRILAAAFNSIDTRKVTIDVRRDGVAIKINEQPWTDTLGIYHAT